VQRRRSGTQSASRGRNEQREAQPRLVGAEFRARGCYRSAPRRNGRRRAAEAGTSWSAAAASVEAPSARTVGRSNRGFGDRAQRTPGQAPGERAGTASAGPGGPGRRDPAKRETGAAGRSREAGERTRRPSRRAASVSAAGCARLRHGRKPAGRSGVPAGHDRAGTTRGPGAQRTERVTCRRGSYRSAAFVADTSATRRPRRGRTPTARRAKPTRLARGGGAQGLAPEATPGGGQQGS
jgi:hypothetical protein